MSEPITWITKNGKHIPIYADKVSDDEKKKQREIGQNEQSAKSMNRLSSDADESKLREELRNKLLDKDSYMLSDEYRRLSEDVTKKYNEVLRLQDRQRELWKIKDENTQSDDSVFNELGSNDYEAQVIAKMFGKKNEKAKAAEEELRELYDKIDRAEERWDQASEKLQVYHKEHGRKQSVNEASVSKNIKSDYEGFELDTHTSYYQDLYKQGKAYIVEMSPRTYLEYCGAKIFESSYEKQVQAVMADVKQTYRLADMMKNGTKMYMPALDFKTKGQEGRHRAAAAILNGIDKIPVMIVK